MDVKRLARQVRALPALNRPAVGLALRVARAQLRSAAWLERHAIPTGSVTAPLPNGRTLILAGDGNEGAAGMVRWRGWTSYEPDVVRVWWHLATGARTVLDIGANVGILSLLAAHASGDGTVWAFEPFPRTVEALRLHIAANPEVDVRVVAAAVGATNGTATLRWDPSLHLDAMATTLEEHPSGRPSRSTIQVPRISIDEWANEHGVDHVDLVKIDVEGAEPAVIAGMAETLERDRPDLVVELLTDEVARSVADVAAGLGQDHYLLTPGGPIRTDDIGRNPSCLNHLFTRRPREELRALWR